MKHRRCTAWDIEPLLMSIPEHPRKIQVPIRQSSPSAKMSTLPEGNASLWQQMLFLHASTSSPSTTAQCFL